MRVSLNHRRILSSTVGSEPLRKFSTLSDSSTAYQHIDSRRHDPICSVLNMELLQFYYSVLDRSDLTGSINSGTKQLGGITHGRENATRLPPRSWYLFYRIPPRFGPSRRRAAELRVSIRDLRFGDAALSSTEILWVRSGVSTVTV